jgi:hypothetical protein
VTPCRRIYAHEANDALAPDVDLEPEAQLGVHARRAVDATTASMDLADPLGECCVYDAAGRR